MGASMRWAGWFLLGAMACGGGRAGGGNADAGAGGTGGPPPPVDAGVPDAGPSADCQGVMPAPPASAFTFDVATNSPGEVCDLATTDGQGIVAAKGGATQWSEFSDVGTRNGSFQSADPHLIPQTSGFVGLSGSGTLAVAGWDAFGNNWPVFAAGGTAGMVALSPAQGDGAIVYSADSAGLQIRRLDATLAEAASLTVAGTFTPRGGAQDAGGAVLALVGAGPAISGIWVDLAKGTAGAPFPVGSATGALARPLPGGGVAVRLDGHWSALLQPGDPALHAAPSWLRDGADFATVRAGKAYALLPAAGGLVDLVSPQGNLCGTVPFPGVTRVSVGADGSVVGSSGPSGCTKVFWRDALR
ncbi:MAG TPA: hypothetical protein VFL36_05125 [Myxococcales bacterium]|nr:hypothetical protein [Myxococcales bacterium]